MCFQFTRTMGFIIIRTQVRTILRFKNTSWIWRMLFLGPFSRTNLRTNLGRYWWMIEAQIVVWRRLTLNIEGDAVGEDLLVVGGDAGERLLVCFSAGYQNIVTLNSERPVWVPVLSGGHFSRHPRLPPARINTESGSRHRCRLLGGV